MKFHEKLYDIRRKQGLSQEELGYELQVSRQTISKWETGQSYPDFQKLVMLSDYFGMTLDELVHDLDVEDIREKNLTDEKVSSMHMDLEKMKYLAKLIAKILCVIGIVIFCVAIITFIIHLIFPDFDFIWQSK
ncbi:helix-turn-helix domain-containing protein [Breznakia pachnodae]|uniref:Transcriptional regulator with XRE-family HTH domain n=1 Tax=Breznakia pachnodae TaxID=265178 RepID=A0ABU0E5B3_9FIRM|nr:helix-turn-helix transcriptional regulator [Breznakia pachnodae]MDQ0362084.1 transcriptional regulator with XRE-family HTH domain [Breznakia pachnodae]